MTQQRVLQSWVVIENIPGDKLDLRLALDYRSALDKSAANSRRDPPRFVCVCVCVCACVCVCVCVCVCMCIVGAQSDYRSDFTLGAKPPRRPQQAPLLAN